VVHERVNCCFLSFLLLAVPVKSAWHTGRPCVRCVLLSGGFLGQPLPPSPPLPVAQLCSATSQYYGAVRLPSSFVIVVRLGFTMRSRVPSTQTTTGSPGSVQVDFVRAWVSDRGVRPCLRYRHVRCCLPPISTASAPEVPSYTRVMYFAAQYPARTPPCRRFALVLRTRRTARSQCDSLLLHCWTFHSFQLAGLTGARRFHDSSARSRVLSVSIALSPAQHG